MRSVTARGRFKTRSPVEPGPFRVSHSELDSASSARLFEDRSHVFILFSPVLSPWLRPRVNLSGLLKDLFLTHPVSLDEAIGERHCPILVAAHRPQRHVFVDTCFSHVPSMGRRSTGAEAAQRHLSR